LFVGPPGGSMRRVIDDVARDRAPVFMLGDKSLIFYSNRNGAWQVWKIGIDGSGLQQLTSLPGGAVYAVVSPKGDAVVANGDNGRTMFITPLAAGGASRPLEGTTLDGTFFGANDWSADGTRLAGTLASASGRSVGVAIYDLAAKTTTQISTDETYAVRWLPDSRRVILFANGGSELVVLDTATKARTPIKVRLPAPSITDMFAISRDGRFIYYGGSRSEADIWIAERR